MSTLSGELQRSLLNRPPNCVARYFAAHYIEGFSTASLDGYHELPLRYRTMLSRISKGLIASSIAMILVFALQALAQDRATVVPGMKVLLENACVRVQYHDVAVGKTIPMHSHPNYVVYTLRSFKARIRLKDGTERISQRGAGEAYWNPPITHSVENLGRTPIHNLIVELKPNGSCSKASD